METLILKNSSKKDLSLLLTIARKMGMDLEVSSNHESKNVFESKFNALRKLAIKAEGLTKTNNISMDEIVDETNIVRKQMYDAGKHNN
jgi:hypothetical protein